MSLATATKEKLNARLFKILHRHNLVYNTCWEDPALDRVALNFQPDDRVVVITSAGCNALDYLLAGVAEVNAVDVNPIQNALLELKVAGIRRLDHASFFEMFGQGGSPRVAAMYSDVLRPELSSMAQSYWDRHLNFFDGNGWRHSFYYRGTSGLLARLVLFHAQNWKRLRGPIERLLAAQTVAEQREIYERKIRDVLWTRSLQWLLERTTTLSLL
jgi:S-adenosylmethionine-diacylglycerol 3-amino-3-carboxypropyl transferase